MRRFLLLILMIGSCICLYACGDSDKQMVKETVSVFLEGYKKQDGSISQLLIGTSESDMISFEGVSVYFAEKLEYEISSCKSLGNDVYNVKVNIKTIDFGKLFEGAFAEVTAQHGEESAADNINRIMERKIDDNMYDVYETECNILVNKIANEYRIQLNSDFANGLTGGMNEYLSSLVGGK